MIAKEIIDELKSRGGFDAWWDEIDDDTQEDVKKSLEKIIYGADVDQELSDLRADRDSEMRWAKHYYNDAERFYQLNIRADRLITAARDNLTASEAWYDKAKEWLKDWQKAVEAGF